MTVAVTGLVGIYTDPGHGIAGPGAGWCASRSRCASMPAR